MKSLSIIPFSLSFEMIHVPRSLYPYIVQLLGDILLHRHRQLNQVALLVPCYFFESLDKNFLEVVLLFEGLIVHYFANLALLLLLVVPGPIQKPCNLQGSHPDDPFVALGLRERHNLVVVSVAVG